MVSLLEAKKDVPLVVKAVIAGGGGGRGRGRRRGGRRSESRMVGLNWCRRFSNMGIREGAVIRKVSVQPFSGPVIIRIGNCEIAIGRGMASSILVEEVKD
jgi:Fe2+ transport system protein FeoA